MHSGRFVFSQLMEHLPAKVFRRCVHRYRGDRHIQSFTCLDQFLCLAFAQLTHRESLRDIEVCLRVHREKLYHMGIRGGMARNTLANANRKRDWRIHADFAQALIRIARPLYAEEDLGLELDNTVYALDSSTVDLCLSVFPWALFRSTKSGVKLHTLLDLRGNIPAFIHVSEAKLHDVNILDLLVPEPGAFYVMDRGYVDFKRLFLLHRLGAFFVVRAKSNIKFRRRYSAAADRSTGIRCDQTIVLTGLKRAASAILSRCAESGITMRNRTGDWTFSPTTSPCPRRPSPTCTAIDGRWNCFSNGSSNTCASSPSSAPRRMQ